jgi:hypothetical protein
MVVGGIGFVQNVENSPPSGNGKAAGHSGNPSSLHRLTPQALQTSGQRTGPEHRVVHAIDRCDTTQAGCEKTGVRRMDVIGC